MKANLSLYKKKHSVDFAKWSLKDCITIYKRVSRERMGENHNLNFPQNIVRYVKSK